jgi:hypothetical protein
VLQNERKLHMTTLTLTGASGVQYQYTLYEHSKTQWHPLAGNYAFAYQDVDGKWVIVYIGETEDFSKRLPTHERWDAAKKLGCLHIIARTNSAGIDARQAEERDLCANYQPSMNTHHVGLASLGLSPYGAR